MKRITNLLTKVIVMMLIASVTLSMFACAGGGSNNNSGGTEDKPIEILLKSDKDVLRVGETAQLTVEVKNSNKGYFIEATRPELVEISDDDKLTITKNILTSRNIGITAYAREDVNVSYTINVMLRPKIEEGAVGELTSEMIEKIGNSNITATASVTDYYIDNVDSSNNYAAESKSIVKMNEDKWYGTCTSIEDGKEGVWDTALYGKGNEVMETAKMGLNQYGVYEVVGKESGYPVETYYVDKNNQIAKKTVTDNDSFPVLWNNQHYWNHLGELVVSNFKPIQNEDGSFYKYNIDPTEMDPEAVDGLWLPTYLVYSLTANVADTFHSLTLYVNDGEISKIVGTTEYRYYIYGGEATTAQEADYFEYTEIIIELSDIGSTVIPMPEVYEAGENNEVLKAAIENMQGLKNYTVHNVDSQTSAPSYNPDDYSTMSVTPTGATMAGNNPFQGNTSSGTLGKLIQVTEDAIFVEKTGKYSSGMDDNLYFHEYYGYKKIDANHYDYFEKASGLYYLEGLRNYAGDMHSVLPTFDFASELFRFAGNETDGSYKFVLKELSASKAIGMETVFEDGSYADFSARSALTIIVGTDGYIKQVTVPYNISDTYRGAYVVTYSNISTTAIGSTVFTGYENRIVPSTWADMSMKYYKADPLAPGGYDDNNNADEVIKQIFGKSSADLNLIQPGEIIEIFGDEINGPFFDCDIEKDENGNSYVASRMFAINLEIPTSALDENSNLMPDEFFAYYEPLHDLLLSKGFSRVSSDFTGGKSLRGDRVAIYEKGNVRIRFENNWTRFFRFYFTVI